MRYLRNAFAVTLLFALALATAAAQVATSPQAAVDALPSWNDGRVKKAILDFVAAVTDKNGRDFVPPEDRIAAVDNDGTLWCEQPPIQGVFTREYKVDRRPKEEFQAAAAKFFATSKHKKFNVLYKELIYLPMIELVRLLQANGFKVYICSAGDMDFMRVVTQEIYGIAPENVIGTSYVYDVQDKDGKLVLIRTNKIVSFCDKLGKPKHLWIHIGKRPILAVGNVRAGGDVAMLQFCQGSSYRNLQLMIDHDDEKREFAYAEKDNASLNAAAKHGWPVISMRKDWRKVFAFEK